MIYAGIRYPLHFAVCLRKTSDVRGFVSPHLRVHSDWQAINSGAFVIRLGDEHSSFRLFSLSLIRPLFLSFSLL